MKKLMALLFIGLLILFWNSCDEIGPEPNTAVKVTIDGIDSVAVGGTVSVEGEISADEVIDTVIMAVKEAGTFSVTHTADYKNKKKVKLSELSTTITVTSATSGTYTLEITAKAGSGTDVGLETFVVTGGGDLVTKDITLGSWNNNTYGSSLDADAMTVYKVNEAATNCAIIDIWYSNTLGGADRFYSPKKAAGAEHPPKNWTTQNETMMAKVPGVNFDAIKLQSEIDGLWANATGKEEFLDLNNNDVVVLSSDQGKACLILFVEGDGSDTGKCKIKGKN